jgi:Golgi phosphoprotein 3
MQTQTLTLAEELLLLMLEDAKGTVPPAATQALPYGLAGATLMELTLMGRLASDGEHLVVADATPTGDALLDEALAAIAGVSRPRESAHWVRALGTGLTQHRERLEERLVERGILHREEHRTLGVFPSPRYPMDDPRPEAESRQRIRAAVLGASPPDARTETLISLAQACRVLDGLFTREEREAARGRVAEIVRGEALGKAVRETVTAINAAVIAAVGSTVVVSRS